MGTYFYFAHAPANLQSTRVNRGILSEVQSVHTVKAVNLNNHKNMD